MKPTLVVMAAGMGSRYGGHKQIDPIGPGGEIIVDYSVYDAMRAGFGKAVFVINEEMAGAFHARFDKIGDRIGIDYVCQRLSDLPTGFEVPEGRIKPWGTAHAVYAARRAVDGPFAAINADDFYGPAAFAKLHDFLSQARDRDSYDYCMVGYILENTLTENGCVSRGVCSVTPDGYLREVTERVKIERRGGSVMCADGDDWRELPADSVVSMNMWGFTPSLFQAIEDLFPAFFGANEGNLLKAELYLPDVVTSLLRAGKARVRVLKTDERWFGVTYQQDKGMVKEAIAGLIAAGRYPAGLWER